MSCAAVLFDVPIHGYITVITKTFNVAYTYTFEIDVY